MNRSSTLELLSELRRLNVKLTAEGDRLRYTAPSGVMTAELRAELAARKKDLLDFLKEASLNTRPQPRAITPISRDGDLPLSFAQMRLWLLDRLEPGTATYNLPRCYRMKGKLNVAAFERSLTEIVRRHEALRTCFLMVDWRPVQKIAPPEPFKVSVVDLQGLAEAVREEEAARLALVYASQPFDLGKAPLMRATLLKLAAEEQVLLLNMHHIAFDGWSFDVFERELSVLYTAFLQGQSSPLPELPVQYADFAVWQREWLKGEVLQAQLDYWKEKLGGSLPVLELPTDRPRPGLQTYNGSTLSWALSPKLTEGLKTLSRREGVTLFVTLLAAVQVLLLRYTGQEDLLVGTPSASRNRAEIERLIGLFLNMLVMRTNLSGNPSFRELLVRVQETALGVYTYQDLPFEQLVDELNPKRDLSSSPFFQVLLSLEKTPMQPLELVGLETSRMYVDSGTSKYDLSLYVVEKPEGLSCEFEYNTDLFNADRIERMAAHLQVLLEGVVANPEQRLSELPLLTDAERRRLLVEWNQTRADFPRGRRIHDLWEEQVERTPESTALSGPSLTQASHSQVSWTYAELNQRANALACYLQALGVGPEVLVAVCLERTVEMVVGLLAILKAGGAYLPLDPAYPSERLAFILEETQVPVVLTQQSIAVSLPSSKSRLVCLDDPNLPMEIRKRAGDESRFSSNAHDPSHPAYVIYTSGSTGKPKGVEICHRAVVNFLHSMREVPGLEAQDTLLSVTTLSFDIFGLEIWLPLTTGAKVVIASEEVTRDGRELAALMRRSGVTVMQATPSTWRLLLESGWEGNPRLKILCGGEAWPAQLAEQLLPKCASLWNMYGPTETTIWSAVSAVEKGKPILIGPPMANTQFYVVDGRMEPVPVGVPGELLIGGEGLARGYWKRPELTAEKFISDPFRTEVESRLYRTGDLVRYRADGTLEFLGRIDQQVKIRGFRIELGEIESVLRSHLGVREGVVAVREDGGNQRLVAYLVASAESDGSHAELRNHLKAKLPDYMVPSAFVVLEALPLTANGKIDRKALPAPERSDSDEATYVAPRTPIEKTLAALWAKVLKLDRVGRHDNFFELGGNSLLAASLFARIEHEIGKKLPLGTLFQSPTVELLASALDNRRDHFSTDWVPLVPIQLKGSSPPLFLVHGAGGNVLLYRSLAEHLVPDYPLYGLQSRGLDGKSAPLATIEEMAIEYLREIRTVQRKGPYYLGGYCLGGTVAYEMAQILQYEGEEVALVAMLDTYNFSLASKARFASFLFQKLRFHLGNFAGLHPREIVNYVFEKVRVAHDGEVASLISSMRGSTKVEGVSSAVSGIEAFVQAANDHAAGHYLPRPYAGRLTIFKPQINYKFYPDPNMGWGDLALGGLDIVELSIYPHAMLVEPFVRVLASELKARMGTVAGVAGPGFPF